MRGLPTGVQLAAGAVGGGAVALIVGAVWVVLAPDDGFADLAAAAVTAVVLIPVGTILGVVFAGMSRRRLAGR